MKLAALIASMGLVGCGGGKGFEPVPDGDVVNPGVDAAVPAGWTKLIARDWEILAGATDTYRCRRVKVPEDMWISGFQALSPLGTHHQVLTITESSTTLGDYDCAAHNLDSTMLYAAGVGTEAFEFPTGVATKLTKDSYININLHLYNSSDVTMTGESGVLVKTVTAAEVTKQVDFMFAGTYQLSIPPDGQNHDFTGGCTVPASNYEIFSLWPHMHQIANHQKITFTPSGGAMEVLLDEAYTFEDQAYYPMVGSKTLPAGGAIRVTCSYNNPYVAPPNGRTVGFGDSSTDEMCFAGFYKYPAGGNAFQCVGQ
ncbi:MAG: hypothetical protein H0T79_15885 [Deltaproteobacteria bacterium]|nr:hypothetical protein [Deltaproteobacteria bacterium]